MPLPAQRAYPTETNKGGGKGGGDGSNTGGGLAGEHNGRYTGTGRDRLKTVQEVGSKCVLGQTVGMCTWKSQVRQD